ncbi:MAG TPA: hypothetical protein VFQ77_04770 [Pseudonocardiaceae bacterium]|nr:hypothetical protein [Pseudonocardiaceae bacterium]
MAGNNGQARSADPAVQPLSLDLLADLHAGVLDEAVAAVLRARVAADPSARTVLAALDATVADLAALPRQRTARIPDEVATRLESALAAEAQQGTAGQESSVQAIPFGPGTGLTAHRRRAGWAGLAVLAAAAAVSAVLALSALPGAIAHLPHPGDVLGAASGVQPAPPPALTRSNLGSVLDQALGARDYGPLTPSHLLRTCLSTHRVPAGEEPLGALEVTLDGRRGVLLVLPADRIGQLRLLVVGPNCGPAHPVPLAEYVVPR